MTDLVRAADITRVPKVWGEERWIVNSRLYCGKILELNEGWQCSMHMHKIKDETFYVQSGKVRLEIGAEVYVLLPGDSVHVPPNTWHRFAGLKDSIIIEFSTHHEDEDSYRMEPSRPMDQ